MAKLNDFVDCFSNDYEISREFTLAEIADYIHTNQNYDKQDQELFVYYVSKVCKRKGIDKTHATTELSIEDLKEFFESKQNEKEESQKVIKEVLDKLKIITDENIEKKEISKTVKEMYEYNISAEYILRTLKKVDAKLLRNFYIIYSIMKLLLIENK